MKQSPSSRGSVLLFALVVTAITMAVTMGFLNYFSSAVRSERVALASAQALQLAEGAIDKAIYELNQSGSYTGEANTALGNGTVSISVASIDSRTKRITATAYVPNSSSPTSVKTVRVNASINSEIAEFNYGVQIGAGGLDMNNSSRIIGNAYSNGNIIGNNSARIQGSATVAGATGIIDGVDIDDDSWSHTIRGNSTVGGNATHSVLQSTTVTGNGIADAISSCTIGGTAIYDTRSSCSVSGGITTPNPTTFIPAEVLPLPISEAQIDTWESEATVGGTVGSQSYSSGSRNLGPKKINGDLTMSGDAQLVITGTLWVTGEITLSNNAIIRLASSYGSSSGIVIAGVDESASAGYIEISNSAQALGSGTSGSYLVLLSQREMGSNAIKTSNSSAAAILYAGEGQIEINNSAALKEITAYKLKITNSATVTYESGLQDVRFSSGPGGSWTVLPGTYTISK